MVQFGFQPYLPLLNLVIANTKFRMCQFIFSSIRILLLNLVLVLVSCIEYRIIDINLVLEYTKFSSRLLNLVREKRVSGYEDRLYRTIELSGTKLGTLPLL
jgi:hypothetical protein